MSIMENTDRIVVTENILRRIRAQSKEISDRLNDRDNPSYIDSDSYVTRADAHEERAFLNGFIRELTTSVLNGHLDLSETVTSYGYDPEDALYETDEAKAARRYRIHIDSISDDLDLLRSVGVTIDTTFSVSHYDETHEEAKSAAWDEELKAELALEGTLYLAGQNGQPLPEDADKNPDLLPCYLEGLNNPVIDIQNFEDLFATYDQVYTAAKARQRAIIDAAAAEKTPSQDSYRSSPIYLEWVADHGEMNVERGVLLLGEIHHMEWLIKSKDHGNAPESIKKSILESIYELEHLAAEEAISGNTYLLVQSDNRIRLHTAIVALRQKSVEQIKRHGTSAFEQGEACLNEYFESMSELKKVYSGQLSFDQEAVLSVGAGIAVADAARLAFNGNTYLAEKAESIPALKEQIALLNTARPLWPNYSANQATIQHEKVASVSLSQSVNPRGETTMGVSDTFSRYNERQKTKREQNSPTNGERSFLGRVEGYDKPFIQVTNLSTGEEVRVRLADATEFARAYVFDENKTEEERLQIAQKRIANRASITDMTNVRNLNYMPENGIIEIEQPRKIPGGADHEYMASWFKGVSNEPEKEIVLEGKISLTVRNTPTTRNPNSNIAIEKDVNRDRKYGVTVIQDKLSTPLVFPHDDANIAAQNKLKINAMMSGFLLESVPGAGTFKPNRSAPTNGTQALVSLELDNGMMVCHGVKSLIKDADQNLVSNPDGIDGYFSELKSRPLSMDKPSDMNEAAIAAALSVLVGHDEPLPVKDADTQRFIIDVRLDLEKDKIRAIATPQVWLSALNSLKTHMTDLPIDDRGVGKLKEYTNKGYFSGKLCLRTATNDGTAFANVIAKSALLDAGKPMPDYKPLWIKPMMEQVVHEIHPAYTQPEAAEVNDFQYEDQIPDEAYNQGGFEPHEEEVDYGYGSSPSM